MNNKIPQQKTFMILKEAETLDYIPLKRLPHQWG